ncbi:methyl-accepting chemotaxis protein [Arcobacter aquimarinus]|uniref:4HB sensor-containing MCP-domain signal transduction protein n=1 Tax=Arcobacter aquimarinus TaxID=1315211 RepID=A0AAE7B096_9BACT|nr:methyl-accepting chemotaxis protein [Arcobacter aquimarinus]QKE25008.1 4HB sensor-containing MCP-domain signal transduction protein [Arcobacter aquimarinus]RXI31639.1 chemotaxis protein [Arcobacter aquimarinus]
MSVKNRLRLLSGILLFGLALIGFIAFDNAKTWSKDMHKIGEERVPALLSLGNLNTERMAIRAQTLEVLTLDGSSNIKNTLEKIATQREESWKSIDENWKNFNSIPRNTEAGKKAAQKINDAYKSWRDIYIELDGLISELKTNQDLETQKNLLLQYKNRVDIMVPISNEFGKLIIDQKNRTVKYSLDMMNDSIVIADRSVIITIVVFLIISSIGLIFTIFSINLIINSLEKVKNGITGFFSFLNNETKKSSIIEISSKDEFGQMAQIINDNIVKTETSIKKDNDFVNDVTRFINELSNGNMLVKIEKDSDNPSLKELKILLDKLQDYLEHTIARDLNTLISVLERFKKEDFTARFPEPYAKVAVIINDLGDVISNLLKQSLSIGLTLDNGSDKLLKNVEILNTSSNQAAASLEETAAALEEITSTVISNATNVAQMAKYSEQVSSSAKKGQELARSTTSAMDDITNQVNLINEAISVIDQIAFQTNILSLNAAVEAATAGEAGKGFAVVAQEVRNLASRSAEAAKEIKTIVENATNKAKHGKSISYEMIQGYEELLENITKTTQTIEEIARASKEQEAGITQINDAVTGLDRQTQQNAQIASQTKEIALETDNIAKEIVADAMKKEFTGKNEITSKSSKKENASIKETSVIKSKKIVEPEIKESVEKKSTQNEEEWESF